MIQQLHAAITAITLLECSRMMFVPLFATEDSEEWNTGLNDRQETLNGGCKQGLSPHSSAPNSTAQHIVALETIEPQ